MTIHKLAVLTAFSILLAVSCSDNRANSNASTANTEAPLPPPPTATIDQVALGQKVFEQNCAICHKQDGTGGRVEIEGKRLNVENLTEDKIKKFSDEKIIGYIMNGVEDEGMPAFKGRLSEGEMRDVVRFIRAEFHGK